MIWLLFIPIIWFMTFKDVIANNSPDGFLDWCFTIFIGCFLSFLISLAPILIAALIGSFSDIRGILDKDYDLVALREKDGISGRFFIGSGYIGDKQYYFWYRKDGDAIVGGKTPRSENIKIKETEGTPIMRTFKTEYLNKRWEKYYWIVGFDVRDNDWCPIFYIPKGSIKEGYTL